MKKILYVGGFELPDKNAAAHRVMSIAKALRSLGYETVFVGVDKELAGSDAVSREPAEAQGFCAYAVPYPRTIKQWIAYLTDSGPFLDVIRREEGINAVIFYNFPSIAMQRIMHYCHAKGIACIADVTEWYSASGRGLAYFALKGADTFFRMRVLHPKMDGLIVISEYLKQYYAKHQNMVMLPPTVDREEDKWKKLPPKNQGPSLELVYAGSPAKKDRIDILIAALKRVRRAYRLNVIGMTESEYLERYPQDREFLCDQDAIRFLGRLPHRETLDYVAHANYSCFFREEDRMTKAGFSTKFVEAISCGTPVLSNKTSNLADYAQNNENAILLDSIEVQDVAAAIERAPFTIKVNEDTFDYRNYIGQLYAVINTVGDR